MFDDKVAKKLRSRNTCIVYSLMITENKKILKQKKQDTNPTPVKRIFENHNKRENSCQGVVVPPEFKIQHPSNSLNIQVFRIILIHETFSQYAKCKATPNKRTKNISPILPLLPYFQRSLVISLKSSKPRGSSFFISIIFHTFPLSSIKNPEFMASTSVRILWASSPFNASQLQCPFINCL